MCCIACICYILAGMCHLAWALGNLWVQRWDQWVQAGVWWGHSVQARQKVRGNRWDCKIKMKNKLGAKYSYYWILIVEVVTAYSKQPYMNGVMVDETTSLSTALRVCEVIMISYSPGLYIIVHWDMGHQITVRGGDVGREWKENECSSLSC